MSEKKQVLNDQELEQAAGGDGFIPTQRIYNKYNDPVGLMDANGVIEYWPCPNCGRPLHCGPDWYWCCIPCDKGTFNPEKKIWNGTLDQFKVASEDYSRVG